MFTTEYKLLIDTLIESTRASLLIWSKGPNALAYTVQSPSGQIILIDIYYSIVDELPNTCIDFTVFTNERRVIDEIVLCRGDEGSIIFDLLDKLYKEIEIQYSRTSNPGLPAILASITQSLVDQLKNQ